MKWILIVLAVLLVLVLVVVVVGALLPQNHSATRTARVGRPVAEVWAVMTDFGQAAGWREGLDRIELLPTQDGKTVFRETSGSESLTLAVEVMEPPRRLVTRILDTDKGFGGTWTYALAEDAGGTRITITEDGIITNVVFRFMARFVFGYVDGLESYLKSIGRRFGETVTPRP